MILILDYIHRLLFIVSVVASLYIGFYLGNLAQDSFGFPWNYLALILSYLVSHIFFIGIILNKVIFRKIIEQNTPVFTHDDEKGCIGYQGEETQYIPWVEVVKIEILTTDKGPWEEELWWLFHLTDVDDPIAIPQGAENCNEIFTVLEKYFNDVDMEAVLAGATSVDNALFRVWSLA